MQRIAITLFIVALAACLTTACAEDAPKPQQPKRVDVSKTIAIEAPVKNLLLAAPKQPVDEPKPTANFKNAKVAPGKVRWHDDFATARAASKVSGKPVLLFQLMGNLDDRFC